MGSSREALPAATVPARRQNPQCQDRVRSRLQGPARPGQDGKGGANSFGILHGRDQRSRLARISRFTSAKRGTKHCHSNTQGPFSSHDRYFIAVPAWSRTGSDRNQARSGPVVLTHFLHANRYLPPDQARGHASLENALPDTDSPYWPIRRRSPYKTGINRENP